MFVNASDGNQDIYYIDWEVHANRLNRLYTNLTQFSCLDYTESTSSRTSLVATRESIVVLVVRTCNDTATVNNRQFNQVQGSGEYAGWVEQIMTETNWSILKYVRYHKVAE